MDDLKVQLGQVLGSLNDIKGRMVVKEDLSGIQDRLVNVEKGQEELAKDQKEIRSRLLSLEKNGGKDRDRGPGGAKKDGPRHRPLQREPTMKQVEDFIDARRSLYLSPVQPYIPNIKDFLLSRMEIPPEVVADLAISKVRRIHPRKLPPHRQRVDTSKKTLFSFRDSQERDMIVSYASNLRGEARMDVVIPDHLMSLKSRLERLTYKIRKHAAETDKKVTTSIRLDDSSQGLVAAVREGKEGSWLYYTVEELEELESTLGRGPVGEEEDQEEDDVV